MNRDRNLPDPYEMLRRGYSNERIAERTRHTVYEVSLFRRVLDLSADEIAQLSFDLKRMTPRSVGLEQGVGTLSDAEPTQLTGQISGG